MIMCNDKLYELSSPMIMGILNITPNSFYADSRKSNIESAINQAKRMIDEGADIIDVGGISTRPGADLLSEDEELKRVLPVIQEIRKLFPDILLSIDTFRSNVARIAVENGVNIINDVYGGWLDNKMFDTVAELNVPYILMHSRGDASNMQDLCEYKNVVKDVIRELSVSVKILREKGVKDVIVDPGFGFAKTMEQNYELFSGLPFLEVLECPVLVGISRKSMIYSLLKSTPDYALNGTTVLNAIALMKGAKILRVHDVKEAVETRCIFEMMNKY
ncbi:MAG: dihydropteroate synthase [Brumimicrobium sp.]